MMEKSGAVEKQLLLDTDWITALFTVGVILVFAFVAGLDLMGIMKGITSSVKVTWETWVLVVFGFYCFLTAKDWRVRAVFTFLIVETILEIAFWLAHAPMNVQLTNAAIFRIVDAVGLLGGCVYAIWWLSSKVRRA
jgi:hypothetical protein